MARALRTAAALLALLGALGAARAESPLFDAETGYRIARYRAPVTAEAPAGVTRVGAVEVERLIAGGAILIDAMAAIGAGPDPATGAWRLSRPRIHIPGSVWLPDVGKGDLSPAMDAYFRSNLERLTDEDKARPIVIYCLADCWMGWNAAKRAASYGYMALHWFPDGTDGWIDLDRPLVPAEPVPMTPESGLSLGFKPGGSPR